MSFFGSVLAFVEGVKSAIDASSASQGFISDAISDGIENAFKRIKKPLERSIMKITLVSVSVFFIFWGAALFLDNFVPYHGLGFVVVGTILGIIVLVVFQERETE